MCTSSGNQKRPSCVLTAFQDSVRILYGAVYFAGSETTCANLGSSDHSAVVDPDGLDIRVPLSSRMSVRVGYVVSGNLSLSANLALS